MKNKILNTSLILAVVVILAVFAFYVRLGATADKVVVLRTSGMTCSSCVQKITAALQSERGVAATEVDLEAGVVVAGYDSKQVAPERLARRSPPPASPRRWRRCSPPGSSGRSSGATSATGWPAVAAAAALAVAARNPDALPGPAPVL